ncbi:stage IV sporulation protein A [Dethiobacter alkaliphilus]|uniref:Stage IV sporulation protein A n=1 Tax=Dethiobacter alkaliphilus AHT 1 TaxID=555088 RepID=C0GI34_DETAL|nr:stage IV sporulation protein A [Dethiobacter alkaliphilus]EEG77108.1 stage IV sporulation protein A [Dethiobacter alkaliphilus AHT 1]
MKFDLIQHIVERTGGDIYLGVVGPVRTGKSTFIKKFMELVVIPNIADENDQERARDELPQSSAGKTIMTTEPKFIPDEAIEIKVRDNISMRVRLVDCVGYTVSGALGYEDEGAPRMVTTPWFDYDIPFEEAAEVGTRKVITDHSTIGVVVTTDGSISDIPRAEYVDAEQRVVDELKELGKPFVMLLNSARPYSQEALALKEELAEAYNVPVIPFNALQMMEEDVNVIFQEVLYEFPVREVNINLPSWVEVLDGDHWLRTDYNQTIRESVDGVTRLRDVDSMVECLSTKDIVENIMLKEMDLGTGKAVIEIKAPEELFEQVLSEICGIEIEDQADLLKILKESVAAKKEYDKLADAMEQVKETGYGIVPPQLDEMSLEEPEIIRQGGRFGVRLKASAPSLHVIRVDVKSEFAPIVGTEKQSEELVNYIMGEFEENPEKIWQSDIFGKSLHAVVKDGIGTKLGNMPPNAQDKLQETLEKIINEGSGGLIAIIL